MWRFFNARVDLLRDSMSYNETGKKKNITKQIVTRYTQKGNGILILQCVIWTLLCIMPAAARPRPPRDNRMNLSSSEYMKLEDQKDMNVQGEDCRPQILAKTLPEDDFQQIECETSTCTSKSRITFEKTSMHATQEWISVFEIYNKSNYHALNTNSEYSLKNRALFNAFPTKHLLYIQPLRLDDRGMWRCVVYDTNNISYTSITPLKVDSLYVTSTDGNITIRRPKMEIATEFTCVVDGVFPKLEILWKVNSVKSVKGISSSRMRDDKLWSVKHIVKLSFDKKGENNVTCSIKTDKRNPWIQQKQSIDIKEAATKVIPKEDRVVLLQDNSMVNFECVGSGYRPNIHWTKDGEAIHDKDTRYDLKQLCNESSCIGSVKAHYVDPVLGCAQTKAYTGVYSCVISLENPHHSTKMSPKYNVIMSEHDTADGMFPTLCSIVFGFILSALHTTKKQCSMVKEKKKRRFKPIKKEFAMDGCLSLIFDIFQSGKFLVPYAITMILLFEPMAATSLPSRNYHQRVCNPHISANILDEVEFKQIECEISSCNKVSKITYEKKGVTNNTQWTPVFEGYNKTVFQTVDMEESNYTLTNRNDYMAFHTKHLLYIKPAILKDQGEWRCVVHDEISGDCVSNSLEVNIYVTPKEDNLKIAPSNVILLSGQSEKFDCIIDGIHPEPDVWWTTNNTEIIQGTPFNKKRMDGLWFVMNRVRVGFHETGKHALFCVVKTKTGDPWLQNSIHVDVKEDAYVSDPTDARTVSVTRNSSFTIDCHGSGYKPSITWQRDGTTILDTDYRYSMAHLCNDTVCRSSLTLKPMANLFTCASEDYIEVYTCTVALEKTFSSNHTSANINVHILNPPQINGTQMNIIAGQSCNTMLTCDVCRATSSVWKYNGTILMGEEVTHLSDGSLLLHSNMRFGQYTRTVRNAAGEVNCNVYLHDSGTTCNIQNYSTVIGVVSLLTLVALVLVAAIIVWKKRGTRYNPQNHKERQHGQSNILLIEKPEQ